MEDYNGTLYKRKKNYYGAKSVVGISSKASESES